MPNDLEFKSIELFQSLREQQLNRGVVPRTLTITVEMGDVPAGSNERVVNSIHHINAADCMNDPGIIGEAVRALTAYRLDS